MSFYTNVGFFTPEKPLTIDASSIYTTGKQRIVRIVTSAAVYAKFSDDKTGLIATTPDATNGIYLLGGQEYFISSDKYNFLKFSGAVAAVELVAERG